MSKLEIEQEKLLKIVKTWQPNEFPEFRGFRCALCQQYKNEAWHNWLNMGGYRLPIHLCSETCEHAFQIDNMRIDEKKEIEVDRATFGTEYQYSEEAKVTFRGIIAVWPTLAETKYKAFACDYCKEE